MTTEEIDGKMMEFHTKLAQLHRDLVDPARAAANQMRDAGMHSGAEPLLAILFQIDSITQERLDLINADPLAAFEALVLALEKRSRG